MGSSYLMTQRYAVFSPPTASVHYDAALRRMGLGGQVPDVPTVLPTPRPDEEAAPEPDGPEKPLHVKAEEQGFAVKAPPGGLTLNTRERREQV
jgi:hypothetical protein